MRQISTPSTRSLTALAVGLAALACGDATGVDPEDLVGTWSAFTVIATNPANSAETSDLLAEGVSLTFVIEANGRIETIFEFQDIVDRDFGTLTVTDGEFTLLIEGRPLTGTISRRDDTLTIDIITGMEWDFGDDGLDEPATMLLEMLRSR